MDGWTWVPPLVDDDDPLPPHMLDQLDAARVDAERRNREMTQRDVADGLFHRCSADEPGSILNTLFEHVTRRIREEPRWSCPHVGELRPRNLVVARSLIEACDRPSCVAGLVEAREDLGDYCFICEGDPADQVAEISTSVIDGRLIAVCCHAHLAE